MKLLFDFFPIIIFFAVYKFANIYAATATAIAVSLLQVLFYWLKYRRFDKMLVMTACFALFLGGSTLLLHDEIFIKWKPTALYWLLTITFLLSKPFSGKPLIQRMLEANIKLPDLIWSRLNLYWALFFLAMGIINLYVVYNYSTDIWVNFKLVGIFGLTLIFIVIQSIYLTRYIQPDDEINGKPNQPKD